MKGMNKLSTRRRFFGVAASLLAAIATTGTAAFAAPKTETAILAAGCFWSMEAVFQRVKGVQSVEPGYAGGSVAKPSYEAVCSGRTGHAEAVRIVFDPAVVKYSDLVRVLVTISDPTTLNRQGADEGTQYRSAIFYQSPAQKEAAEKTLKQVGASGLWKSPIVTAVSPYKNFYSAEAYHRDYYNRHSEEGYCRAVIKPKLDKFGTKFAALSKTKPAVASNRR